MYSIGLQQDGTVWFWGDNVDGQAGNGTSGGLYTTPQQVPGLYNIVQIDTGANTIMALNNTGTIYMWGRGNVSQLGQTAPDNCFGVNTCSTAPIPVDSGNTYVSIAMNDFTAFAVRNDNVIRVWGFNDHGGASQGFAGQVTSPATTSNPGGLGVPKRLAVGAHTLAIGSDSLLYGAGYGAYGQLGINSTGDALGWSFATPGFTWKEVAALGYHSMGIESDGSLYVWGSNVNTELGILHTNNCAGSPCEMVPVKVGSTTNWAKLARGNSQNGGGAIRSDGSLWRWGTNSYGELGIGSFTGPFQDPQETLKP